MVYWKKKICKEAVSPKSTASKRRKKRKEKKNHTYHTSNTLSHKGNQVCPTNFAIKHLNVRTVLHVITSVPKTKTVTTPVCHCLFILPIHKNEKNENSLRPSLNQICGIQYFHFIPPRSPHIHIIPSSRTTLSHYLYSTCPGKNIEDRSK